MKWKATLLQVLYLTTQVMETSTTRERFKKLIGLGTDVGIAGIVIGMMMIDIRGALQNRGDIAFRTRGYLCIVCILICTTHRPLALMCTMTCKKGDAHLTPRVMRTSLLGFRGEQFEY